MTQLPRCREIRGKNGKDWDWMPLVSLPQFCDILCLTNPSSLSFPSCTHMNPQGLPAASQMPMGQLHGLKPPGSHFPKVRRRTEVMSMLTSVLAHWPGTIGVKTQVHEHMQMRVQYSSRAVSLPSVSSAGCHHSQVSLTFTSSEPGLGEFQQGL
jgi:hypothetical protein